MSAWPKRVMIIGAKALLGGVAVTGLLFFDVIDFASLAIASEYPLELGLAIVLIMLTLVLASVRWTIILRMSDTKLSAWTAFNIVVASTFVSQIAFGTAGGEAMRAVYLARLLPSSRAQAISTLFSDRLFGAVGLLGLVLILAVPLYDKIAKNQTLTLILWGLIGGLALVILGFLLSRPALRIVVTYLDVLSHKRVIGVFVRILRGFLKTVALSKRSAPGLVLCLLLSILSHLCAVSAIAIVARQLAPSINYLDYAFAGAVALWANLIPLTPGGLGFGEGAFQHVCQKLANDGDLVLGAGAAFFVFRALSFIAVVYGIIPLLFHMPRSGAMAEVQETK